MVTNYISFKNLLNFKSFLKIYIYLLRKKKITHIDRKDTKNTKNTGDTLDIFSLYLICPKKKIKKK